jgi:hypothetical protein
MTANIAGYKLGHGDVAQGAAVVNAAAATATAFPAGGTGTAAGGWDTAANRDAAIASFAALLVDVADLRTKLNATIASLRSTGVIIT